MAQFRLLSAEEQDTLRKLVLVFVEEKTWVGAGGLELNDEIRVTIAADACLMLLGRDHSLYENVSSIVVYPATIRAPERARSFFDNSVVVEDPPAALLGEAHLGGPVILTWDAVKHGARDPKDGHNVVIHEFAHKIDMLDRRADGTPPLASRDALKTWAEVASEAFLELRASIKKGERTFLDPYAGTNEVEFFAVATEYFFERSLKLKRVHPKLYGILKEYFQQDPASRHKNRQCNSTR